MTTTTQTPCATGHTLPGAPLPGAPNSSLPPTGISSWKKLTKAIAFDWLSNLNQSNRPKRPLDVKKYTAWMNSGQFNWNTPDPIAISPTNPKTGNKKLLNGQHRLEAFFESNLEEAWFFVIEDIDESIYETMDQGISRSASDFFNAAAQVKKDDVAQDGETSLSRHNKWVVTIVNAMARYSTNVVGAGDSPSDQAKRAQKYAHIVNAVLEHIRVKSGNRGNDAYSSPVVAAFANAMVRYGMANVLPLVKRYGTEAWTDQNGKDDPLRALHQLIRSYNAKEKTSKKKLSTQQLMYNYSVAAIRTALSHSDHWTERLLPTRTASDFGENAQWETRIRQNITIAPENIA